MNLNVCALIGKVASKLKEIVSPGGKFVVEFYLRVDSVKNGDKDLHKVCLFEETARRALEEIKKGDHVWVKGKVRSYLYKGELKQEIWASEIDKIPSIGGVYGDNN